jgi:cardiolipin synthase A/B
MSYCRVLLLAQIGSDPRPAFAAARGLAPRAERLVVLACPRPNPAPPRPGEAAKDDSAWLDSVRAAADAAAATAEVGFLPELEAGAVDALVEAEGVELVVAGPAPPGALGVLAELRRRRPVAVLWIPAPGAVRGERPLAEALCVALGDRARAAIAAFLRDHGDPALNVTVLSLARPSPTELAAVLAAAGIRAAVALAAPPRVAPWRLLDACVRERGIDLVVLPRFVAAIVRNARWAAPVLVLPTPAPAQRPVQRPLDVADPVDLGGALRLRLGSAYGVGRNPPIADQ